MNYIFMHDIGTKCGTRSLASESADMWGLDGACTVMTNIILNASPHVTCFSVYAILTVHHKNLFASTSVLHAVV